MEITLARFDLVSIRLAVLCAQLRSLSAASREFPCSLSTGNLRLNTLEATLDRAPFTRDRRGLQAAAGKIFKRHARPIMRGLEGTSLQVAMAPKDVPLVLDFPNEQGNGAGRAVQGTARPALQGMHRDGRVSFSYFLFPISEFRIPEHCGRPCGGSASPQPPNLRHGRHTSKTPRQG